MRHADYYFPPYLKNKCEDSLPPLGYLDYQSDEKTIPLRDRDRPRNDPQLGSRFSELMLLDVPGTATEQVRTCGFRRNSSSFDSAPKIRDSVLLNSFESFFSYSLFDLFRNLRDIVLSQFRVNCVLCSTVPVLSGVSLETAASFFFFLRVAMLLSENSVSDEN